LGKRAVPGPVSGQLVNFVVTIFLEFVMTNFFLHANGPRRRSCTRDERSEGQQRTRTWILPAYCVLCRHRGANTARCSSSVAAGLPLLITESIGLQRLRLCREEKRTSRDYPLSVLRYESGRLARMHWTAYCSTSDLIQADDLP
jgi:hypothetical protein